MSERKTFWNWPALRICLCSCYSPKKKIATLFSSFEKWLITNKPSCLIDLTQIGCQYEGEENSQKYIISCRMIFRWDFFKVRFLLIINGDILSFSSISEPMEKSCVSIPLSTYLYPFVSNKLLHSWEWFPSLLLVIDSCSLGPPSSQLHQKQEDQSLRSLPRFDICLILASQK